MSDILLVTDVRFCPARPSDRQTGLLGFASVVFNDWLTVDGVTLRLTREGRFSLSFPLRTDSQGEQRGTAYPRSDEARRAIEAQVIAKVKGMGYLS